MVLKHQLHFTAAAMLLLCLLICCVCFSGSIRLELFSALNRCLTVIIPSLYAMMILSRLLIENGIWRYAAKPFRKITEAWFGLPDGCFALWLLSQIAGYPVGAGMLLALTEQGSISKEDSRRLACVCFGGGPAFLLGLLGNVSQQGRLFLLIFCSNFLANLILTVAMFRKKPVTLMETDKPMIRPLTGDMLINATETAGRSLLKLCGVILCFSAGIGILRSLKIFQLPQLLCQKLGTTISTAGLLESFLEVTNAAELHLPVTVQIPFLAGLISFGGVCVLMQAAAAGREAVSFRKLFQARITAGLLSVGFCAIGQNMFPAIKNAAEPIMVSAAVTEIRHEAVFPSMMLVIMMLFVFWEAGKINPRNP